MNSFEKAIKEQQKDISSFLKDAEKAAKRGGFEKRIMLKKVVEE